MKKRHLILPTMLLFMAACGSDKSGDSAGSHPNPALQEQQAEGSYRAILRPLNNSLSGFIPTGIAEIKVLGNDVSVKTLLDDDARVAHMQSIQLSTRCPEARDDRNGDGIIDIQEALQASGEVFIPLDADLSSADAGAGVYPVGSGFTYVESTTLDRLEGEARSRTGQNLNLAGRVVLIHGVSQGTKMPATVASTGNLAPQASVPIACGILQRQ